MLYSTIKHKLKIIDNIMKELRIIENYQNYGISSTGEVFNIKKGKKLKPQTLPNGYQIVRLHFSKDIYTQRYVHRLVAEAYISEIPKKYVVDHINSIKTDNRVENLRIVTQKQNIGYANYERNRDSKKAKPVTVDGMRYESCNKASIALGVTCGCLIQCIKNGWKCKGKEVKYCE